VWLNLKPSTSREECKSTAPRSPKRDMKGVRRVFKGFEISILNWNRDKVSIDKLIYNIAATFQDQHQHFSNQCLANQKKYPT
jgi:hypothetical protein